MQAEDWLFVGLVQARQGVSAAQGEVSAKSEALQQLAGKLATAEAERLEVQRLHEESTPRLKHAEEALQQARRALVKLERPVSLFASRKTGRSKRRSTTMGYVCRDGSCLQCFCFVRAGCLVLKLLNLSA